MSAGKIASGKLVQWRFGFLAAVVVVVVTLIPQVVFLISRGSEWEGSYVCVDPDEFAYSAYVASIISGRGRLDNPYTRQYADETQTKKENLFSIQFFPPYVLTAFAKLIGLSAPAAFILVLPIAAFASSLAIFWLVFNVTGEDVTSAVGVLIILLGGVIVSEHIFLTEKHYYTFGFLRRYIPAVSFPLFFLFCLFVWRAFVRQGKSALLCSLAAGITFGSLVYSYFYIWTAAAAWLASLTLFWWVARPGDRKQITTSVAIITALAATALMPYFYLLFQRAEPTDHTHGLNLTRIPDLFRATELSGFIILTVLAWFVFRKRLDAKSPVFLFAASCAVVPFVVFNQQIITGYSLQPFHYEQFIVNYVVLLGAVVSYFLIKRSPPKRLILWIALALGVGLATAARSSAVSFEMNQRADAAVPVFRKLDEDSRSGNGVVLFDNPVLATAAPTYSSVPVLWAPHMYTFGTTTSEEEVERFYQYLYFTGVDASQISSDPGLRRLFTMTLFGLVRVNQKLSIRFNPVTDIEVQKQLQAYSAYAASFSQEKAMQCTLSFVVLESNRVYDLSNLDRWYQRDSGYHTGGAVVYRVLLKTDQ